MSKKYLYYFSEGNDAFGGDKVTMKNTLGGKGAGLAEMTAAGMPVPQGFTITTDACTQYYADGRQINDDITADIFEHLKGLEEITGKKFGDNTNPLLVSVRSGARQSMPGMMDTILNLGLNDEAVEGLAKKTGNLIMCFQLIQILIFWQEFRKILWFTECIQICEYSISFQTSRIFHTDMIRISKHAEYFLLNIFRFL